MFQQNTGVSGSDEGEGNYKFPKDSEVVWQGKARGK